MELWYLILKGNTNLTSGIPNGNLLSPGNISNSNYLLVSASNNAHEDSTSNCSGSQHQALLKQMQKKYSKSVDCYHYLEPTSNASSNSISTPSNSDAQGNKADESTSLNQVKHNSETNSTVNINNNNINSNNNIQLQRQYSQTNSPLIPRRNDYEPMTRVTIQRQQRVCDVSPTRNANTPLSNMHKNVWTDDFDESTLSYANGFTQSNEYLF